MRFMALSSQVSERAEHAPIIAEAPFEGDDGLADDDALRPYCAAFCTGTGLFSASAISSSNSASRSGANHVGPNSPHPTAPRGATRTLWCLTVSEYPPRGRAGDELRQVARWLAETLAQPDMLKGAAAHAS